MENSGRFIGIERRTIWFVLGSGITLSLLLAAVAIKQDYFSRTTSLYFFAPNAQGLNKGMAVKFIGFKVGSVEDISMEPNATVKVRLSLRNNYIHLIGRDAKAKLIKEALVGESVVEIVPGTAQARQIAQNDVLAFERGRDIGELAESLVGQIQPILADVKKITAAVGDADEDIRQSLKNINAASAGLVETAQQANTLAREGHATLAAANHALRTFDEALPGLVLKADDSLENIRAATAEIRKMTTESAEQVPQLLSNGNALVQDSREIVGGVRKSWPVRNLLQEPEAHILPLDGYAPPSQREQAR